jgi:two-component system, sensor histidine kinase
MPSDLAKTNKLLVAELEAARKEIAALKLEHSECKQAEEALKESEEKYRTLFECTTDAIFLVDIRTGRYLDSNKAGEALLGRSVSEIKELTTFDVTPKGAKGRLKKLASRAGPKEMGEVTYLRPDGTSRVALLDAVHLKKNVLFGIAYDITEQREAENALKKSEERYRSMVHHMTNGVAVYEPVNGGTDFVFKEINEAGARLGQRDSSEHIGKRLTEVYPGDGALELLKVLRKVHETDETAYHPAFLYDDDEVSLWVENHIYKLPSGEIVAVYDDITSRKQAEEALKKSESRHRAVVETATDAIVSIDQKGNVLYWNKAAETMFGYRAEDIVGQNMWMLMPSKFHEQHTVGLDRVVTTGRTSILGKTSEGTGLRKDGSEFPLELSVAQWKARGLSFFTAIIRDVTLQKKITEDLVSTKEKAESANRAKSEFLATMSHEIRTPLNGVLGMIQILQQTQLDSDQQECLEVAFNSGKNLLRIIGDILDIARIESGKMDIREEPFAIGEVMSSIQGAFMNEPAQKDQTVSYHVDPALPENLLGDAIRIRQILFNTVGNAIKFTPQGEVNARAYPEGLELNPNHFNLCLEVSDTGIGIPAERLEAMFTPFTQVDGTSTREYGGTGLGLSIVKRFAELMNGSVHIESEEGVGTTIRVSFPVKTAESGQLVVETHSTTAAISHPSLRVLLAEDDSSNQLVTRRMLEKQGHIAACVSTGQEVLVALENETFDLILMDVQMPVMDGTERTKPNRRPVTGNQIDGAAGVEYPHLFTYNLSSSAWMASIIFFGVEAPPVSPTVLKRRNWSKGSCSGVST